MAVISYYLVIRRLILFTLIVLSQSTIFYNGVVLPIFDIWMVPASKRTKMPVVTAMFLVVMCQNETVRW